MDVRTPIDNSVAVVANSVTFNPSCSHFCIGLNTGYAVFNAQTGRAEASYVKEGFGQVQMLGTSNILGMVGGGRYPKANLNKVIVWDDEKSKAVREISCITTVRGLQLLSDRVVVLLLKEVRLYRLKMPPQLLGKYPTASNIHGLCCISTSAKKLAFPGQTSGQVQLIGIDNDSVSIIPAHSSALRAMAFSRDGDLLATASEKGTLIRVWSVKTNAKIAELRRGADPAAIFSLAFSPSGAMLASTSDKGTLHIFDVRHKQPGTQKPPTDQDSDAGSFAGPLVEASDVDKASNKAKWGILAKIPFGPQYFSDDISFATAKFAMNDDPAAKRLLDETATLLGLSQLPKGILGWIREDTVVVVGAGVDARYERFVIATNSVGTRRCTRHGWQNYLKA